ncbi:MAG: cytochrome c [Terrimonas sp.]|nr:cytochrome c [Terrimonas sp.]
MKKIKTLTNITAIAIVVVLLVSYFSIQGCAASKDIAMKSGAQLWAENCQRCHNTPSPSSYSPEQWETIGLHMQSRALITAAEREKIVSFLKNSQ